MPTDPQTEVVPLRAALRSMLVHPVRLLRDWNWKAGVVSALVHGFIFFLGSRRAGSHAALKATLVEAVYSVAAAGLAGTVTQRLRHAVPRVPTALLVWTGVPVALLLARFAVHNAMHTPHLRGTMVASFVFAALASGFNWFAMARGAFVTGEGRSFARDLLLLPKLIVQFLAWPVHALRKRTPSNLA